MILRRFDPLSCSLKRVHASMNMFARQGIKSPEYHHMICIGKTKCTSEKGLLSTIEETNLMSVISSISSHVKISYLHI